MAAHGSSFGLLRDRDKCNNNSKRYFKAHEYANVTGPAKFKAILNSNVNAKVSVSLNANVNTNSNVYVNVYDFVNTLRALKRFFLSVDEVKQKLMSFVLNYQTAWSVMFVHVVFISCCGLRSIT